MLLKFRDIKTKFAISLHWVVDTMRGIDHIQTTFNLPYGITFKLNSTENKKYQLAALSDESHDKSVCLAGILAKFYPNLILVHRVSEQLYWLCVIKNGVIWSGVDLAKSTAGDYLDDYDSVKEVAEFAKQDFKDAGLLGPDVLLATDTAQDGFPDFAPTNFIELILKLEKNKRKFLIKYIEPRRAIMKKVAMIAVLVVILISGGSYIYHANIVHKLLYKQQIEAEKARQQKILAEQNSFAQLQNTLAQQQGAVVINRVMAIFKTLPLQSKGWALQMASYDAKNSNTLKVDLTRSSYGTLNTFLYAYTPDGQDGEIGDDNNSGSKTLTFDVADLKQADEPSEISRQILTSKVTNNLYRLISYMQTHGQDFQFTAGKAEVASYDVHKSAVEIGGQGLWRLKGMQQILASYDTFVIDSIDFTVSGYDMNWTLKGEIYG
jgi:hypothetical protein